MFNNMCFLHLNLFYHSARIVDCQGFAVKILYQYHFFIFATNSIQFISTPFFGIRFKLVIEETQFETTWQVTKLNGTRQLNLPNVPSVGPSRTLFHHIRADERMPKKRTRLFYKAKPDPPLLKEKQR